MLPHHPGQRVVDGDDEPLGQLANLALRDVQAGAGGHTEVQVGRVQPRVFQQCVPGLLVTRGPGHVQPQGVVLGHVLLLRPGDRVVMLHQPHHPVQVKLAAHGLLARQKMISRVRAVIRRIEVH